MTPHGPPSIECIPDMIIGCYAKTQELSGVGKFAARLGRHSSVFLAPRPRCGLSDEMARFLSRQTPPRAEIDRLGSPVANERSHDFQHFSFGWFVDPTA